MYYIFGLGNPGKEYELSRHNIGRSALFWIHNKYNFQEWEEKNKHNVKISKGTIDGKSVTLILSSEFMNKSGVIAKQFINNLQKSKKFIVIHDDIDMGLGSVKILFNRGAGGHNGVLSINKSIKTKAYFRIKIGISPKKKSGIINRVIGEKEVIDFVIGKFTKKEKEVLNNLYPLIEKAILFITTSKIKISKNPISQTIC